MAQFGGHAAIALDQDVVADGGAAYTGADGQIDQVVMTLPGSIAPFAQKGQVGIVAQENGDLVFAGKQFGQGIVRPGGDVGGFDDDAGVRVERAGGGDGDGFHRFGWPGGVDQVGQTVIGAGLQAEGGARWTLMGLMLSCG